MNFEETAHNIIDLTLKAGASDCDVVLAKSYGKSISCRFQKIEDLDESNEKTIGIRALVDQRQACLGRDQGVLRFLAALPVHGPEQPLVGGHPQAAPLGARTWRSHPRARRLRCP